MVQGVQMAWHHFGATPCHIPARRCCRQNPTPEKPSITSQGSIMQFMPSRLSLAICLAFPLVAVAEDGTTLDTYIYTLNTR